MNCPKCNGSKWMAQEQYERIWQFADSHWLTRGSVERTGEINCLCETCGHEWTVDSDDFYREIAQ
jgi:hypothetical protein